MLDFGMFDYGDDRFAEEMLSLLVSWRMVKDDWPIERYCTDMSHDEAVFRVVVRFLLFWSHLPWSHSDVPNVKSYLSSHPSVVEFGRVYMPDVMLAIDLLQ